ncbi:protein angel homolog 2-like [Ptychodera flava]|uniref:protein angel homolog 2-like n=1 Tax=Ptychodera flava TaxID=63121 RepID=UPI003969C966
MNPYQRLPWPWNVPRFTEMWNHSLQHSFNSTNTAGVPVPLYRCRQPNISQYTQSCATSNYAYRLPSPQQSRFASHLGQSWTQTSGYTNLDSSPVRTSQTTSVTLSSTGASCAHSQDSVMPTDSSPGKRCGKRSRQSSDSDETIPTTSKARISSTNTLRDVSHGSAREVFRKESTESTFDDERKRSSVSPNIEHLAYSSKSPLFDQSPRRRSDEDDYHVRTMDLCSSDDGQNEITTFQNVRKSDGEESDGPSADYANMFERQWIYTGLGRERNKRSGLEFSVLSYNILAQGLLNTNMDLYCDCPPDILDWNYRKQNILREIKDLIPDIMCLQEVEEDPFNNFFQPQLAILGYDGVFKKRTGDKQDGCAIFYKNSVFRLVKHKLVEYYKPGVFPLDRDNVGTIVLLQPRDKKVANQKICVANTHLLFNPKRGDVKLAQLGVLFAEIDNIAFRKVTHGDVKYHPVILCGDMNSEPYSPLYKFINRGKLQYDSLTRTEVSGQYKGQHWGFLPMPLWKAKMGVTDTCQYVDIVDERRGKKEKTKQEDKELKDKEVKDDKDNKTVEEEDGWTEVTSSKHKYGFSNTIKHSYNLKSAYTHRTADNQYEVTSNHKRTNCTVDYIFYSVTSNIRDDHNRNYSRHHHQHRREGKLKLLARLSLLSDSEATLMGGLPNRNNSSDHFSLLAKFLLEKDYR